MNMKRRIISVFVILSMVCSLMPFFNISVSAAGVQPSGSGTVDDPYKIGSVEVLIWFRDTVNAGQRSICADLTNNINLSTAGNWEPINRYEGVFDGRNYTLDYMTCVRTSEGTLGFFGYNLCGQIRNLHITNGTVSGNANCGGLIGTITGSSEITNCSFEGSVSVRAHNTGGLIGMILGGTTVVNDSWAVTTLNTTEYSSTQGSLISNVQDNANVTINRCYANAKNSGNAASLGFVSWVGMTDPIVNINDCYDISSATGFSSGAVVGHYHGGTININNYHYYGTGRTTWASGVGEDSGNRNFIANSAYALGINLDTTGFRNQNSFVNWDFRSKSNITDDIGVWELTNNTYPTLQQRIAIASADKRILSLYDSGTAEFNLTDYFNLTHPNDGNYNQKNRFTYYITDGTNDLTSYSIEKDSENITAAEISGDKLILNGQVGIGTYGPYTIKAVDKLGKFDTFTFPLTAVVKHKVPVPRVDSVSYSRSFILGMLPIRPFDENWTWTDGTICPKDNIRWPQGYEAFYQYDEDMKDYYDTSLLDEAGVTYSFDSSRYGITTMMKNFITESDESPWDTTVTVLDADKETPIGGATVSCDYDDEFPNGNTTAADGTVYAQLSKGNRTIRATAAGYQNGEDTFEIKANNSNTATIKLEPVRYSFNLPSVHDADNTSEEVENARVTVNRIPADAADTTLAWNGGDTTLTADAKAETVLPDGKYLFTSATYGYTKNDKLWGVVSGNTIKYYTDQACTAEADAEHNGILYAQKMTEPMYHVQINRDSGSEDSYTVTVDLKNIKATYGTFGLRWDNKLFDMTQFKLDTSDNIDSSMTVEEAYGGTTTMESANANGYYDFMWMTDNEDNVFDTETQNKTVATMKFKIKDKNLTDEITVDSFGIKPWSETKASKENVASLRPADENDTYMYWRKTDADNNPSNLKEGRIADYKSAVNVSEATPITSTVETGGFFQGWVNGSLADPVNATAYDIMSEVEYGFKITNAVIRFHAFNEVTGEDLENALIRMFNSYQQIVGNDKTDDNGIVTYSVNTVGKTNPTFTYNAALDGYWPIPLSGLVSDRPVVEAETAKVTDVEVPMEQKIYHKPVLKKNTAAEDQPETLELVTDAQLGGEKFAYNDRPYHFRVKAARGYRILAYPTQADVYVNDKKIATLNPDVNGLFTLGAEQLHYANNEDLRALETAELTTLRDSDADYADWSGFQPDSEGFRGYNVVVKFDNYEVTELEYIIEGVTNDLGHVTYTPDTGDNAAKTQTDRDSDSYYEYIMVQTQKSHPELDPPTAANHHTGTFTFAPDQEGYLVEKVYINGLRINTYDDMPGFEYTFGNADMDCNITVIYYDGEHPSDDTVMTLVVGEFGFADIKKPEPAEEDIILTRRTFLNPTDDLEFEAHAMKGFELYKVEKEVEGENRVDVTTAARNGAERTVTRDENGANVDYTYIPYKVSKPTADEKDITVYVSYKDPRASKTPNLFVKSYVYSGEGVNNPAGILIYSLYDSVEIDLEANTASSYKVKGVMLSPYEDLENIEEWDFPEPLDRNTYRYDSLTSDLAIGAIYTEKTYKVHGYVDLSQKTNFTRLEPSTGAVITFVRLEGDTGDTERRLRPIKVMAPTTISRKGAQFTADLPEGRWNVYVTKQGYVTYKITEYTFTADHSLPDDHVYEFCDDKVIVPYIGSAVTGELINVRDAAYVKSGLREGINEVARLKADVDNDDNVCYRDLMYVWHNYNQRLVEQPYSDFASRGSADVKVGPTE